MNTKNKQNPRGLKTFLIITYAVLALFVLFVILFGALASETKDADLNGGIGDVFKYHFSGLPGLFAFKFNNASNIVYFGLSGLLYLFIVIALIYIVVGIIVSAKRKRPIIIPSLIASLLVIFVFMMAATGLPKYWAIINKRGAFENDNTLMFFTIAILICSALFTLLAYISYFASLLVIFKGASEPAKAPETPVAIGDIEETEEAPAEEEQVMFEPVQEEAVPEESIAVSEPEPEPEPEPEKAVSHPSEKDDLRTLLKEVVRDIVRDEIARNNANQTRSEIAPASSITGATFGGPLVVQYFNGGINSTAAPETVKEDKPASTPQPQPEEVKEEEIPAPIEEEKVEEQPVPEKQAVEEVAPAPEAEPVPEEVQEEVLPEPEPVVEPEPMLEEPVPEAEPVVEPSSEEKKPIIRIPFTERMLNAEPEMQKNYNELKNEILSYGVNSRVSNSGDTFRLHRKTYVKITIAGLSLKLYFALNPDDYKDSTLPIQNAGHKGIYAEIPLVFKVKSGLSMRRCKQLIADVFEKNGFEQGEIGDVNWVEELKKAPVEEDKDED